MTYTNTESKGRPITILDEGVSLSTNISSIDFTGAGVTGSAVGTAITETISGYPGTSVVGEIPSGTINGSNKTFTLAHTPQAGTLKLYVNGSRMQTTSDYSLSTATITFVVAPETGSNIVADYYYT